MQISRSEQKRQVKEVESLVHELVKLPAPVIAMAPCPDEVKDLLQQALRLSGKSRQRHIKFITKQIQAESLDLLYSFLGTYQGKALSAKKKFHEMELYRDALINEALERQSSRQQLHQDWDEQWHSVVLDELQEIIPGVDISALTKLAALFARTRNPRYSREIFRALHAASEQQQRQRDRLNSGPGPAC